MALDLKKILVDENRLDIDQNSLELILFTLLMAKYPQYGRDTVDLYRMMSKFHHERIPMIILISGTKCTGKSSLATILAERLNLPGVLKTDLIYDILSSSLGIIKSENSVFETLNSSTTDLIEKYDMECKSIERALKGNIRKTITEGKSIILEGNHIRSSVLRKTIEDIMETQGRDRAVIASFFIKSTNETGHSELISEGMKVKTCRRNTQGQQNNFGRILENILSIQSYLLDQVDRSTDYIIPTELDGDFSSILEQMHSTVVESITSIF